jgi:sugar phosphate isomerase/epimerase
MKNHQLAAQLYTVRSLCQTPSATRVTLEQIRTIGYRAVEVAGICPIPPDELLKMTTDSGLAICSIHDGAVLDAPEDVVEKLNVIDCDLAVYSYPAGFDLCNADDVHRLVRKLIGASEAFRAAGKTLCYHHHSLEFVRFGKTTVLEHILDSTDPASLSLELDTYWVQHGGGSPAQWCTRLKNRLPILHMKDYGNIAGTPTMMEIGNGNLNWSQIIPAAAASGCRWFVVEQDTCPGDPLESLKISYDYIQSNLMS